MRNMIKKGLKKVYIVDKSLKPIDLQDDSLQVLQLPANSGLNYGLKRALEKVETPYVMRKGANLYVARTDKVRSIGRNENIRMMDHQNLYGKLWRYGIRVRYK